MSTQTSTYQTYDSYKDSSVEWIGDIPKDWDVAPLKALLNERKEKNNPVKTERILSLSMHLGVIPYEDKEAGGNKAKSDLSAYNLAYPGDIVMNSMNVVAGSVGLSNYFGAISPVYYAYYQRNKSVDVEFVNLLFQSEAFQKSLLGLGNGILVKTSQESGKMNTIRMRIPAHRLKNLPLPCPKVEIQRKIKTYLNDECKLIDQLIHKKQQLIDQLQEKRQALITQAVTKGLDPNVKMKDSGVEWIGDIPEKWNIRRLKNLFYSHASGIWGEEESDNEDDVICVRVADFDYDQLRISDGEKTLRNITKSDLYKKRLRKGDLLLEKSGGGEKTIVGRAVLFEFDFPAVCANFIEFHRFNNLINSKYGMYLFAALYSSGVIYKNIKQTTGIQNLDLTGLYSQLVVYPDIEEQKEIVDYLDSQTTELDLVKNLLQKQIKKLKEFKSSLIYNAVTGKIKV